MGDPDQPKIPDGAPQDVKDFFECKSDKLVWKKGKVTWLGTPVDPDVSFGPGAKPGTVNINVSVTEFGPNFTVPASVGPDGDLQVDTSSMSDVGGLGADAVNEAVKRINDWFKHNGKKLKQPVLKGSDVALEKTPIQAPVATAPPKETPPPPPPKKPDPPKEAPTKQDTNTGGGGCFSTSLLIGGALVLLLIAGLGAFALGVFNGPQKTPAPLPPTQPPVANVKTEPPPLPSSGISLPTQSTETFVPTIPTLEPEAEPTITNVPNIPTLEPEPQPSPTPFEELFFILSNDHGVSLGLPVSEQQADSSITIKSQPASGAPSTVAKAMTLPVYYGMQPAGQQLSEPGYVTLDWANNKPNGTVPEGAIPLAGLGQLVPNVPVPGISVWLGNMSEMITASDPPMITQSGQVTGLAPLYSVKNNDFITGTATVSPTGDVSVQIALESPASAPSAQAPTIASNAAPYADDATVVSLGAPTVGTAANGVQSIQLTGKCQTSGTATVGVDYTVNNFGAETPPLIGLTLQPVPIQVYSRFPIVCP